MVRLASYGSALTLLLARAPPASGIGLRITAAILAVPNRAEETIEEAFSENT